MKRLAVPLILVLLTAGGCASNEEKILEVVETQRLTCSVSDSYFVKVELFDDTTEEIFYEACNEEPTGVEQTDEIHGRAKTGPYDWLLKNDPETGAWILTSVSWEPMNEAREALSGEPTPEDRRAAEEALLKTQEVYPNHIWIRVTRVRNALALREDTRIEDTQNPTGLGDAEAIYEENVKWAREHDKDAAARMHLALIQHYREHKEKLQTAANNFWHQDHLVEAKIRDMQKAGNDEGAAKHKADLEKRRAERPAQRAELYERMGTLFDKICELVPALNPSDINPHEGFAYDLKELAEATKSGIDCSEEARPRNPDEEAEE